MVHHGACDVMTRLHAGAGAGVCRGGRVLGLRTEAGTCDVVARLRAGAGTGVCKRWERISQACPGGEGAYQV